MNIWGAIGVGVAVPLVLYLPVWGWLLLPWNWEFKAKPAELEQMARVYADNFWAGFVTGIEHDVPTPVVLPVAVERGQR